MNDFILVILCILFLIIVFSSRKGKNNNKVSLQYPYCYVFYKVDDTVGWHLALLGGSEEETEAKCLQYNWLKYEIFGGNTYYKPLEDRLHHYPSPYNVALTSDWIFWKDTNKWFIKEDEVIPYPKDSCELSNTIQFSYSYRDDEEDEEYAMDLNNPEDFGENEEVFATAFVSVKSQSQTEKCIIEMKPYMYEYLEKFFNNLQSNNFAVLHIDEWGFHKFLAWVKEDKIRFMIQLYEWKEDDDKLYKNEYIPVVFDTLVDKDTFLTNFEQFYKALIKTSKELKDNMELAVKSKQ